MKILVNGIQNNGQNNFQGLSYGVSVLSMVKWLLFSTGISIIKPLAYMLAFYQLFHRKLNALNMFFDIQCINAKNVGTSYRV